MIKIIIANNNDILYNSLSNIYLHNELDIEVTQVAQGKLEKLICNIESKDEVIILDSTTSITFMQNVTVNAIKQVDTKKTNIIILVIDSNSISNIKYQNSHYLLAEHNTSILDIVNVVSNSLKDCMNLEKSLDDILWRLGFTYYFKGTIYLKNAILLAYSNKDLLFNIKLLVKEVAKKYNIEKSNVVRSDMDRALNSMLNYIDKTTIYDVFGKDYDGRTISLKYFIDLCVRYLEKQRYCCLEH